MRGFAVLSQQHGGRTFSAATSSALVNILLLASSCSTRAFLPSVQQQQVNKRLLVRVREEWRENADQDTNKWASIEKEIDWEALLLSKQDGSFWAADTFDPSLEDDDTDSSPAKATPVISDEDLEAESWLDTIQGLAAEEIDFNRKEADRADKVRQMQDWGFTPEAIGNTLDVAVDLTLEEKDQVAGMQTYREESYLEEFDQNIESHLTVEKDSETGSPIRSQMVYVDEHACIGCTNCAMIAQSTFFMHEEQGRARVFQQWGDDDETIQIAIETCPVDCIHYVPFEELVTLETERRDQNINFKARLVNADGNSQSHLTGGGFTAPQKISGNSAPRCNNCPSSGCKNCPMYGVGENPIFKKKEEARVAKRERRRLEEQRRSAQKSADL